MILGEHVDHLPVSGQEGDQDVVRYAVSAAFFCHFQLHRQPPDHPFHLGDLLVFIAPTGLGGKYPWKLLVREL